MNIIASFLKSLSLFLGLVLSVLSLQGIDDYGRLNLIVFGLWLIVTLFAFVGELKRILLQKRFIALYAFLFYYFFSSAFATSYMSSLNRCVALLYIVSPILMYELLKKERKTIQTIYFVFLSLVFLLDVFLAYEFLSFANVDDMRQMEEFGEEFYIVVVAFSLCYAIALILPSYVDVVATMGKDSLKSIVMIVLVVFVFVIFAFFLIRSQFFTAILLAIIGVLFSLLYRKTKNIYLSLAGLALLFIGFVIVLPAIRYEVAQHDEYKVLSTKLAEIDNAVSGNVGQSTDMNVRMNLSSMSIETFLENPFFGKNDEIGTGLHVNEQGVGNHAEWLDFLAQYGLCSFFLFFLLFDSLLKQSKEMRSPVLMALFIVLGFLNPLWQPQQMYAAFLYVPLLYHLLVKNRDKEESFERGE